MLIVYARTGIIEDTNSYLLDLLSYSKIEILTKQAWRLHVDLVSAGQNFEKLPEVGMDRWDFLRMAAANGRIVPVDSMCIDGRNHG
jgi:hypothetical protein